MDWSNISNYEELFSTERALSLLQAGFTLILGFVVARLAARGIDKALQKRVNPQQTMLAKRLTFYGVMSMVLISFIGQIGVER